jgi:uncharacterized protein (TIGR02145 family)
MKKLFFLFALLASIAASASVTVTPLSTDFTNKTVTFRVEYANAVNNRVWVWIDLCPVPGVTPGAFQDAVISAASATSGSVIYASTNTRGFFVTASPSTVTATLDNASGKFNWCAYGSDAPPNVTLDQGTYTFKGTTDFVVSSHAQPITSKTVARTSLTVNSQSTFTDATGYPGIGQLYCPYEGSDLIMDATHICQQRSSGAQNWEAWIKDTRDNELYRIVLMPDNKWWLAQNVKYAVTGTANTCTKDECGRKYTWEQTIGSWGGSSGRGIGKQGVCPPGWVLPVNTDIMAMVNAISPTTFTAYTVTDLTGYAAVNSSVTRILQSQNSPCGSTNDYYGFASAKQVIYDYPKSEIRFCNTTHTTYMGYWAVNHQMGYGNFCSYVAVADRTYAANHVFDVRCIRP